MTRFDASKASLPYLCRKACLASVKSSKPKAAQLFSMLLTVTIHIPCTSSWGDLPESEVPVLVTGDYSGEYRNRLPKRYDSLIGRRTLAGRMD